MAKLTLPTAAEPLGSPTWYRLFRRLVDRLNGPAELPAYTVAQLPTANTVATGSMVYVSNESGGAQPAFSDGTAWRRVTDRAVVS